jgi:4-amino-4-deoxy-L-arabinose transferase-like glycosyltransferase
MAVAPAAKIIDTRKKLGLILLAGLLPRLVLPGSIGLDHFDEGIYAFAGEWPFARGGLAALDPALIPYGPPVTSVLIGISNIVLGGPSDFSAILPGLLCGSLAVVVIGRLAAKSFTPQAGLFSFFTGSFPEGNSECGEEGG